MYECNWNKGKKLCRYVEDNNSFISQLVSHPSSALHYADYSPFKIEYMHALNNNAEAKIETT